MKLHFALLRGDGIGPEIVDSAVRVLKHIAPKFGHEFSFTPYLIGGAALKADSFAALVHNAIAE